MRLAIALGCVRRLPHVAPRWGSFKLIYSRAVAIVNCAPLLSNDSCSQDADIEPPSPGRARAEKAAAAV